MFCLQKLNNETITNIVVIKLNTMLGDVGIFQTSLLVWFSDGNLVNKQNSCYRLQNKQCKETFESKKRTEHAFSISRWIFI